MLITLYVIIIIVNVFSVYSYFVKLISVSSGKWSTSGMLFQMLNAIPRSIGVFQIPLITFYTEWAINNNINLKVEIFIGIVLAIWIGLLIGWLSLKYFYLVFSYSVNHITERQSFSSFFRNSITILLGNGTWKNQTQNLIKIKLFKIGNHKLFIYNAIGFFLMSIALPCFLWASYHLPNYRASLNSFVSMITGLASIFILFMVDSRIALYTDKAFSGDMNLGEYSEKLLDVTRGRLLGTFFVLLLFIPISDLLIRFLKYFL